MTRTVHFKRQILFSLSQLRQRRGKIDRLVGPFQLLSQQRQNCWRQDVHTKQTQVVAGTLPGHDKFLFGDRGSWFLDNGRDGIQAVLLSNGNAADRAEVDDLIFASCLNGGH